MIEVGLVGDLRKDNALGAESNDVYLGPLASNGAFAIIAAMRGGTGPSLSAMTLNGATMARLLRVNSGPLATEFWMVVGSTPDEVMPFNFSVDQTCNYGIIMLTMSGLGSTTPLNAHSWVVGGTKQVANSLQPTHPGGVVLAHINATTLTDFHPDAPWFDFAAATVGTATGVCQLSTRSSNPGVTRATGTLDIASSWVHLMIELGAPIVRHRLGQYVVDELKARTGIDLEAH